MKQYTVKSVAKEMHDVLSVETEKPTHYIFDPEQATIIVFNKKMIE